MKIQKIGVLTSGGDVPGLNACIRAVVKTARNAGLKVVAISHGFDGLIDGNFADLNFTDVAGIMHAGGTVLKSARSERFKTKEGRALAFDNIKRENIDALILIGGDGSFEGAKVFSAEHAVVFIGIPKTIDNDISGTEVCIGYDTALNTAVEAIDRIRDTAQSHERLFIVEVMGRDSGFIAYGAGMATGADAVLLPETKVDLEQLGKKLNAHLKYGHSAFIIVVAEGDETGGAKLLAEKLETENNIHAPGVCILGHIQRGGTPSAADRILASRLGYTAVKALLQGKQNVMVGLIENKISYSPLKKINKRHLHLDDDIIEMMFTLQNV